MSDEKSIVLLPDHSFKKREWNLPSRRALVKMMEEHEIVFGLDAWEYSDIEHFLEVECHIYPGRIRQHHIRCVATIIKMEGQ